MRLLQQGFVLSCGVAASALLLTLNAEAANVIINNGQTVNTTQTLNTPDDVGTVEQGGTINAGAGDGIEAIVDEVTVNNAGSVTGLVDGVDVNNDSTVTNSGTSTGTTFFGILADSNNTITNSGTATGGDTGITANVGNTITNSGTATGTSFYGIFVFSNNTITNSGTATGGDTGIVANNNNIISNSGTVTGATNHGILANSTNTIANSGMLTGDDTGINVNNGNTITNSGTVTAGDIGITVNDDNTINNWGTVTGGDTGILAENGNTITNKGTATGATGGILAESNNTITNSGMATSGRNGVFAGNGNTFTNTGTAAGGQSGIFIDNNNAIINSGTVIGGTNAVRIFGTANTLTLLAGSNIQGNLSLGAASNTLVIGPGLNTALAFTGGTIDTNGLPFIVDGGVLYVVDVTGFSVQDEMTNDLTRAVNGAVEQRLAAARRVASGLSMPMNGEVIVATAAVAAAPDNGIWLSGLGSSRDQDGDSDTVGLETELGGIVAGLDSMVSSNTRVGVFAGLASAGLDTDGGPQALDNDTYFGGLYLGHDIGQSFIDLSLTAGWSDFDSDRRIANNQVPGGIEHATADYGGVLISPAVKLGTDMTMGKGTLTPSIRFRYVGLFLDGYAETGSAANLTVADRAIDIFDIRGQLAYAFAASEMSDGSLHQTIRLGVDGTYSDAGSVDATLVGQALQFDVASDDAVRGFVGYDAVYAMASGASLNLSAEAGYDTRDALTFQAKAGFAWAF